MRRNTSLLAGAGVAIMLASTFAGGATAASLRPCLTGHSVKVVKGQATMLLNGHRVKCRVVKKATPQPTPSATSTTPVPSGNPIVRFAGDLMNDLVIHAGLTVTLRNTDPIAHTLVIASEGISVLVPANDISAFLAPSKTGTYQMTLADNPNAKATLTVVP